MVEAYVTKKNGVKLNKGMSATVAEEVSSHFWLSEFLE